MKQYAVYKGEELLVMGTAKECADQLGVTEKTIYNFVTKGKENKKDDNRKIAVVLEDDE
ncbi:hypothetical protein [Carnobacterium inhibens]|uniref:hypothetical protein n=1 Tax=Carnobacterium inhibens TaxID=147709 RepID=UPI0020402306|nr:hypothetical protein [Carnobacterium inhibens]MCM3511666.1 hypothetical protein [Carnobacterium inhibens]